MRRASMRAWLVCVLLCLLSPAMARQVTVGSKNFTEGVILAEIAVAQARKDGVEVAHKRQLGGTRILWRALQEGDIDAYAEYTGTLRQELLQQPDATEAQLVAALARQGLGMTRSLGFQNTYALGMRKARAQALGIRTLSDLARHPELLSLIHI